MGLSWYVNLAKIRILIIFFLKNIGSAYELDAFVKSCPSDQEIVLHWIRRETSPKEYLQLTKEEPRSSLNIPNRLR
jgi:hypothetical protein